MTKEEILNYITSTPENANRRVLSDMLDELVNSSGSGGGSSFFVAKIIADSNWENFTFDKTFEELLAAVNSFTPVFGYIGNETDGYAPISLASIFTYNDDAGAHGQASFVSMTILGGGPEPSYLYESAYIISIDNTVTFLGKEFTLTPKT